MPKVRFGYLVPFEPSRIERPAVPRGLFEALRNRQQRTGSAAYVVASHRKLPAFYQMLAQLLRAGLPITEALDACAGTFPPTRGMRPIIDEGGTFSGALSRFPHVFPKEHVRILEVAAESGGIDLALDELAEYTEQMAKARQVIRAGLILPLCTLHLAFLLFPLTALLSGGTVGQYARASLGAIAGFWLVVGLGGIVFRALSVKARAAVLRPIPPVLKCWDDLNWWRAMSCLALLARTSLGVSASLRRAAEACRGHMLSEALKTAAEQVECDGTPASRALTGIPAIPREIASLWRTGELTGTLDQTFTRLSRRFAASFLARVQELSHWIPKAVYGLVCAYVAWKILSQAGGYLGHFD